MIRQFISFLIRAQFPHLTPIDASSFSEAPSYPTQIPLDSSNGPISLVSFNNESARAFSSEDNSS